MANDATKAGVKVVSIDSGTTPQPKNVPLIATNNISGAKLAADRLAKAVGPVVRAWPRATSTAEPGEDASSPL